jgi:hypothetical protein
MFVPVIENPSDDFKTWRRDMRKIIAGIAIIWGTLLTWTVSFASMAMNITTKVDMPDSVSDKLESRFDKLEASLTKILEQTKPK